VDVNERFSLDTECLQELADSRLGGLAGDQAKLALVLDG